jgi:hypothetical protein
MLRLTAFTLVLLASGPLASAQWTPTKTYADPANGVTFQYPADWKMEPHPAAITGPNLPREDDLTSTVMFAGPSPRFYQHIPIAFYFTYALAPATDSASCTAIANPYLGSGDDKPSPAVFHGLHYAVFDSYDASTSHSSKGKIYSTYLAGTCYLFETTLAETDPWIIDGDRAPTTREYASMQQHMLAIMATVHIDDQTAARAEMLRLHLATTTTVFRDPAHGVVFRYPSTWKPLRRSETSFLSFFDSYPQAPHSIFAVMQEYGDGGETQSPDVGFAYGVLSASSPEACGQLITQPEETSSLTGQGVRLKHLGQDDVGLGTGRSEDIYTTYRNGLCFVFDELLETGNGTGGETLLTMQQWRAIEREQHAIVGSVRFLHPR